MGSLHSKSICTWLLCLYIVTTPYLSIVYNTAMTIPDDNSNKEMYLSIVNRWRNCDFSKVVEDHNSMWSLLEGNVAKLMGLMKKR